MSLALRLLKLAAREAIAGAASSAGQKIGESIGERIGKRIQPPEPEKKGRKR